MASARYKVLKRKKGSSKMLKKNNNNNILFYCGNPGWVRHKAGKEVCSNGTPRQGKKRKGII